MLLAFVDGDLSKLVLWISLTALFLGVLAMLFTVFAVNRKKKQDNSADSPLNDGDSANEAYEGDCAVAKDGFITMSRNVMYAVGANGQVRSGEYELKSTDGSVGRFNVRVNGLVKEYQDGNTLFLTDGDTICPVSGAVILKPVTKE